MINLPGHRRLMVIATCCAFGVDNVRADNPLEQYLFAGGYTPIFQSGDSIPKDGVFGIALAPLADNAFVDAPKHVAHAGYGGLVTIEGLPAGRYAVVLSREARLDAIQQRPLLSVPVIQGAAELDLGLAIFTAKGGPLTLQLSGVATPTITIAVVPLPD